MHANELDYEHSSSLVEISGNMMISNTWQFKQMEKGLTEKLNIQGCFFPSADLDTQLMQLKHCDGE